MIPATFPSVLDSSNRTKMLVYQVPSITGLTRWVDYIPVKSPASESDLTLANTYANEGFILTSKVNDITGLVPFKDYVPIYLDSTATKAWSADNDGYIPMSELAGLLLDFTTGALDPRIAFTRATNATVTNSAGVITYAPHNLLTYSEQFDNAAWTKTTTTISANAIASPISTTTGDTLTAGGANSTTLHSYTAIAQPYTFSIYIRRRTGTGAIEITADGSTYVAKTITSDWTRFDTTITPTAGTRTPGIRIVTSGDAIDVWGAQLEVGTSPTTYNPTTVKNLLGYSELFDNAAWTKSNSFVQTNLLTYSEAFDNVAWSKSNATVTANSVNAPNGYQTADKLIGNNVSAPHSIQQAANVVTGNIYTISCYAKKAELDYLWIRVNDTTANQWAWFNLNTGTVGTVNAGITATISSAENGFYRCTVTRTSAGTGAGAFYIGVSDADNITNYVGDGTSGIYAWGAQLVQGSDAGAYRRTDAAALPVYYPNHNGVVCAEQLHGTAANGTILESYTASGAPMTFSVWMRRITGTGNVDITMDTGVTWTTQAITTSWARYSITSTPASGARTAGIRLVTSGDVIQVFGAQLSDSASLDPYVLNAAAAPTAAAYYGARFDYDPVTLAPKGLLIEEQRSNMLLNATLAGTNLATQSVTVTAVAHTLSFYGTGTVTITGTYIGSLVGSGAYPTRSTLTFTPTAGVILLTVTGDVQFAQLEIGAFATSFIPTASSQVTRAADVATIQGSNFYSWFNQNEGSIVINVLNHGLNGSVSYTNINDGTTSNVLAHYYNNVATQSAFAQTTGGAVQANISVTSGTVLNNTLKAAGAYKINDFALSANNSAVGTDISGVTSISTQINLGRNAVDTASSRMNGTVKLISYYPQRLSNDVLKGLTA